MTVQPIDNTSAQSTQKIDFQAFRKAKEALAQAEKTGNEDQIAISKEALQQAEDALKNDMKNVAKSPHKLMTMRFNKLKERIDAGKTPLDIWINKHS